jgi:hypothetical protein
MPLSRVFFWKSQDIQEGERFDNQNLLKYHNHPAGPAVPGCNRFSRVLEYRYLFPVGSGV